jgi:cytochrome c
MRRHVSALWLCRTIFRVALAAVLISAVPMISAQSSPGRANRRAATQTSPDPAAVDSGRLVFAQRCEICHYSESLAAKIGPGLKGLYARGKFADGRKVTDASLARRIAKGGKDMPGYEDVMKPNEIQALIAYLKTR